MKYKILITGRNKVIIDDFYEKMTDRFEIMTCSLRTEDIVSHIKYVKPDAFVYCVLSELYDDVMKMVKIKQSLSMDFTPFIVIGSQKDCDDFERNAVNISDLTLIKPLKASTIEENISASIDRMKEEQNKLEHILETRIYRESMTDFMKKAERVEKEIRIEPPRKHILVVDDDSTMLKAIKEQLNEKYDVATAISGKVALKFLEKKKTDLVLLDYEMPIENGPAVLEKIRENPATKDLPVVFLTGITDRDRIKQALVMKPQGYLLKPIEHDKLMMMIERVLQKAENEKKEESI